MPESSWLLTVVLVVLIGALAYVSGRAHSYFATRPFLSLRTNTAQPFLTCGDYPVSCV